MKTIEERAKYAGIVCQYKSDYRYDPRSVESGYMQGATEQKAIDLETACNIFCHTGCPHKTDSYNCLKDKCDALKAFKRMMAK